MVDENYTHLLVIADRSGSMRPVAQDMIGGLDSLFTEQGRLDGKCLVDFVQFDDTYEKVFTDVPAYAAKAVLEPRGMTALLDAVGRAVTEFGNKLAGMQERKRPGKVLVVVVTDGHENASKEYTRETIKEMVTKQTDKYNWEFIFLGANMDAVGEARTLGIRMDNALTFDTNNIGAASASLNSYTTTYRGTGNAAFTTEDRKANASK